MSVSASTLYLAILFLVTVWVVPTNAGTARILIYSATQRFRHDSIPTAIEVLKRRAPSIDVLFDATEDALVFEDANLAKYDAVVFLSTTGEVLPSDAPFQRYINAGGNFVGIHSASDTLRNSTAYIHELGSRFDYHPRLQNFTVNVIEPTHPSVGMLPTRWNIMDEPYNFEIDPRSLGAKVILSADESTYVDDGVPKFDQGSPHPIAWYQDKGAGVQRGGTQGRSFYTSLGHLNETWHDDLFISHILGGITWVLRSNTTRAFNLRAQVGNPQNGTIASTYSTSPTSAISSPKSSSLRTASISWMVCLILLVASWIST